MPFMVMQHEVDPKEAIYKNVGEYLENIEVFNNQILVATYMRPEKTKGGIYITEKNRGEDQWQSKIGLVVKMGPTAFKDTSGEWFKDVNIQINDWVILRPSDGWNITINSAPFRMIEDIHIKGRVSNPDFVW